MQSKATPMDKITLENNNAKQVFRKCGTCAQTFAHLLNREYGHPSEAHEKALDPMAGGIMRKGHQCGMLWGASLAVSAEAHERFEDPDQAKVVALSTSQHVVASFVNRTSTVSCREITGVNMESVFGMARFMVSTMIKGMNNSLCFNLAEEWAPEAVLSGQEGMDVTPDDVPSPCHNCASEVVKKMGGTAEEEVMVAGFAGGIGLSGKGCGALAAAIWMKTLAFCKENPGKNPPFLNNRDAKHLIDVFEKNTKGEYECQHIVGRTFTSPSEHSDYIEKGGCKALIEALCADE